MQQKADKIQYSEEHKAVEWRRGGNQPRAGRRGGKDGKAAGGRPSVRGSPPARMCSFLVCIPSIQTVPIGWGGESSLTSIWYMTRTRAVITVFAMLTPLSDKILCWMFSCFCPLCWLTLGKITSVRFVSTPGEILLRHTQRLVSTLFPCARIPLY